MSRSFRSAPGFATNRSEKQDKRIYNRRIRRAWKPQIRSAEDFETVLAPSPLDRTDSWLMTKDGCSGTMFYAYKIVRFTRRSSPYRFHSYNVPLSGWGEHRYCHQEHWFCSLDSKPRARKYKSAWSRSDRNCGK